MSSILFVTPNQTLLIMHNRYIPKGFEIPAENFFNAVWGLGTPTYSLTGQLPSIVETTNFALLSLRTKRLRTTKNFISCGKNARFNITLKGLDRHALLQRKTPTLTRGIIDVRERDNSNKHPYRE